MQILLQTKENQFCRLIIGRANIGEEVETIEAIVWDDFKRDSEKTFFQVNTNGRTITTLLEKIEKETGIKFYKNCHENTL